MQLTVDTFLDMMMMSHNATLCAECTVDDCGTGHASCVDIPLCQIMCGVVGAVKAHVENEALTYQQKWENIAEVFDENATKETIGEDIVMTWTSGAVKSFLCTPTGVLTLTNVSEI